MYGFATVDVFTDERLGDGPVAVFPHTGSHAGLAPPCTMGLEPGAGWGGSCACRVFRARPRMSAHPYSYISCSLPVAIANERTRFPVA